MTERAALEEIAQVFAGILLNLGFEGKLGFAVLVFDFGTGGNLGWVSNAQREDMINAMKEFIEKGGGSSILKH